MVDTVGYVNAVAGAPSYNGRKLRQLNAVGFAGATAARPLGARSGVRPGTPASTVTATSTTWTCQPFAGLLDGQAAAESGPYTFSFDAVATGPINAASASIARVDIIYVQIDDPSESDGSSVPAVTRKYLAGTVAGTPPATPARSIVIARINVPISGGGSPTVTWVAPYCAAAGGAVYFNTAAEMNVTLTLPPLTRGRVLADSSDWVFNGTAWEREGGGLTLVAAGSVTNGAQIDLVGAFSAKFQNYRLVYEVTAGDAGSIILGARMLSGTTPLATATYAYSSFYNSYSGVAGTFVNADPAALAWIGQGGNYGGGLVASGAFDIFAPFETKRTRFQGLAHCAYGSGEADTFAGSQVKNQLSYNGLRILPATGIFTATARLYGYGNA